MNRTNSKCYVNNPIKWKCLPLQVVPKTKVGKKWRKTRIEALLSAINYYFCLSLSKSMAHIIIKNIGPIKEVELDLNKINVFMGPQSSGKSTIAKIISFCLWVEKNVCLFRTILDVKLEFKKTLEDYHQLHGYFDDNSYICYLSEYVKIVYSDKNTDVSPLEKVKALDYLRSKIIYVPAERNLITLPYWTTFKLSDNNLRSYASDWGFVRNLFKKGEPLDVNPLGVFYYYDEDEQKDYISLSNNEKVITLADSSSGIQSSTSLYLLHKVYCQYREKLSELSSFDDAVTLEKVYKGYLHYHTTRRYPDPIPENEHFFYKGRSCVVRPGTKEKAIRILDNYTEIQYIQSIIEEPELNLFPDTQQALMYELMADAVVSDNRMVITTHSPYILFALNNCVMGGLVGKNIPEEKKSTFPSFASWIDPSLVSVYEIHDGTIKCIQDEDGIIEDNYLNQAYKKNSDEYLSLLDYYEE